MRPVISMVPSWTETLVHARARVVGRTRFCVHPTDAVKNVSVLGGTKTLAQDADLKMRELVEIARQDGLRLLVVLDREENPEPFKRFFENYDCEILVTHVENFRSLENALQSLSAAFLAETSSKDDMKVGQNLLALAGRTARFETKSMGRLTPTVILESDFSIEKIEDALRTGEKPVFYFIWRKPWMIVRADTWIGSALKSCFSNIVFPEAENRYAEISEDQIPDDAILFFSSEPFPFARTWEEVKMLPFVKKAKVAALVDGESLSWFGIRAIRFLEEASCERR